MPSLLRRRWKTLILLAMLALATTTTPLPAAACSYSVPGWYKVSTTLGTPALPAGISVVESPGGRTISISNATPTPLYLIANFMTGEDEFEAIGQSFPDGYGPTHKVVDGHAWVWSPPRYTGKSGWTWQPSRNALELLITEGAIESNGGTVIYFNTMVGDGRPADAAPPAPEQGEIRLVYGDELVVIPVEIAYELNPDYQPNAMADMARACNNPQTFATFDPASGRLSTVTPLAAAPSAPAATPVATATPASTPEREGGLPDSGAGNNRLLLGSGAALLLGVALAWRGLRRRA
jgi:hypothetical protein